MSFQPELQQIGYEFPNIAAYQFAPIQTHTRIKDGLLRFDLANDNTYEEPATLHLSWADNPTDTLLVAHYYTSSFEGFAVGTERKMLSRPATRLVVMASRAGTKFYVGSLKPHTPYEISYESVDELLGAEKGRVEGNLGLTLGNKILPRHKHEIFQDNRSEPKG